MNFFSNESERATFKAAMIVLVWTAAFWFGAYAAYGAVRDYAHASQATKALQGQSTQRG